MRALLFGAAILAAAMSTGAVAASGENLSVCAGVEARSPVAGATIEAGRPTFRWTAEPEGTVRREVYLVTLPAGTSETLVADKPYRLHGAKPIEPGNFSWFVVFYDADGKALCRSPLVAFTVVLAKPGHGVADASIFGSGFSPPANAGTVTVIIVNNRYVVVLPNSPYTGPRDLDVASDDFDGSGYNVLPAGKIGLEIHGNDHPNHITGSPYSDLIFGEGKADSIQGGLGDDTIFGGPGDDFLADTDGGGDTDVIWGGTGGDFIDTSDGDDNDTRHTTADPFDGGNSDAGDATVFDDVG